MSESSFPSRRELRARERAQAEQGQPPAPSEAPSAVAVPALPPEAPATPSAWGGSFDDIVAGRVPPATPDQPAPAPEARPGPASPPPVPFPGVEPYGSQPTAVQPVLPPAYTPPIQPPAYPPAAPRRAPGTPLTFDDLFADVEEPPSAGPGGPRGPMEHGRRGGSDRPPPEPLGVGRGIVRTFGELCITFGLVLLLFVGWQLVWTDFASDKENSNLAQGLSQDWAKQKPVTPPAAAADVPVVGPKPKLNTAFGIVYIPRFGNDYYRTLAQGTSLDPVLNNMGIGHHPDSAMPGQVGNFAVAGHRVTYGKPFNKIATLQPGDPIVVRTKEGYYTYTFRNFDIVLPTQVSILNPVPDVAKLDAADAKDRIMTMYACNPMFSARERFVGFAVMTDWRPASEGPPASIAKSKAFTLSNSDKAAS